MIFVFFSMRTCGVVWCGVVWFDGIFTHFRKRAFRNRFIAMLYTSKNFIFIFDFLIFLECV
ncbi:hypothetical protein KKC_10956 [Listeria fleischmannii subsp. coloradonensis]|nr:hypothetical protein KKC_10956 [Listeria fleischmannii subsp. coloradonensis]